MKPRTTFVQRFSTLIVVGLTLTAHGGRVPAGAQTPRMEQDPSLDNLVHRPGYVTGPPDSLGRVTVVGDGPQDMILIAGAGFGGEVYDAFMASRKDAFRMFAVTLPGFGGTPAPPMPPAGTSYGDQTWTRSAQRGIERLIEERNIRSPVIVAQLRNATQIALSLALEKPDAVKAVVIVGGIARFVSPNPETNPTPASLEQRVLTVDQGYAPQWFKTVTRDTWDDNNYLPGDYARHPLRALQLWRQTAAPPLPVLIRYLCEFWAQDVTLKLDDLRVPTLVLIPGLDADLYVPEGRNYMQAFFRESWAGVEDGKRPIRVRTIPDSRAFIMDDQPEALDRAVNEFLATAVALRVASPAVPKPDPPPKAPDSSPGPGTTPGALRVASADGAVVVERPDASWVVAPEEEPPMLLRLTSADGLAAISVQAQPVPGASLDTLKAPLAASLSGQLEDFVAVSQADSSVGGHPAFEVVISGKADGRSLKSRVLFVKLGDRLFTLAGSTDLDRFDGFSETLARVVSTCEIHDR